MNITLDRNAEIRIEGLIRVNVEPPAVAGPIVKLSASCGGITSTYIGASKIMYTLPLDKQVLMRIAYEDTHGNPAQVDGAVEWESSDEAVCSVDELTVEQHDENTPENGTVMLVAGTKVGTCQISAKADADRGDGVRELVTLLDITTVAGEAVAGTIAPVGEPQDKP